MSNQGGGVNFNEKVGTANVNTSDGVQNTGDGQNINMGDGTINVGGQTFSRDVFTEAVEELFDPAIDQLQGVKWMPETPTEIVEEFPEGPGLMVAKFKADALAEISGAPPTVEDLATEKPEIKAGDDGPDVSNSQQEDESTFDSVLRKCKELTPYVIAGTLDIADAALVAASPGPSIGIAAGRAFVGWAKKTYDRYCKQK